MNEKMRRFELSINESGYRQLALIAHLSGLTEADALSLAIYTTHNIVQALVRGSAIIARAPDGTETDVTGALEVKSNG